MKNPNTDAPKPVRRWLAEIGRRGGEAGDIAAKKRAARERWNKPGARKIKMETQTQSTK